MSRKNPTFKPRHYTIKDLENWGIRIHSIEQLGKWLAVKTEGEFHTMKPGKNPYNKYGDHVAIHSVTLKIRMN
jgi:hypothetical protein